MELVVAFATDDGINLIDRHFGEARRYDLYRLSGDTVQLVRSVAVQDSAHDDHGNAGKAQSVGNRLAGAQVLVNRCFGKNIHLLKRRFVPIVVRTKRVDEAVARLQRSWSDVVTAFEAGENRSHMVLT